MTEPAAEPQAAPSFTALLTPHRSLGPKGFMVLMGAVCAVSFGAGLVFYMIGAWPVIGFMGLDVALIYVAFKLNFRALRLYEMVDLTSEALTVTRVQPSGKTQVWSFNPYWVRLSLADRTGRSTEGVRLMVLDDEDQVATVAAVLEHDEAEPDAPDAPDAASASAEDRADAPELD